MSHFIDILSIQNLFNNIKLSIFASHKTRTFPIRTLHYFKFKINGALCMSYKKGDGEIEEEDPLKIYPLCIKLGSHNFFSILFPSSLRRLAIVQLLLTYSCIYQSLAKSINSSRKKHKIIHHRLAFLLNDFEKKMYFGMYSVCF